MSSHFDASEFIDDDLQSPSKPAYAYSGLVTGQTSSAPASGAAKAPSREDVELQMTEMQRKLADLKNEQQRLERERLALEDTRRRQSEFANGRQEMIQHLTRAIAQIEESEFSHRREAEQRLKALGDLRESLAKVHSINQDAWTQENLEVELTRALTTVDNARMEWSSARRKFAELNSSAESSSSFPAPNPPASPTPASFPQSMPELCKLGLAINWPLVLLGLGIFLMLWFKR